MPTILGPLWTGEQISEAISGKWILGNRNGWAATNVHYLKNGIQPGDLVFTTNPKHWPKKYKDTRQVIEELFEAGAVAVVTDELPRGAHIPSHLPIYQVENTRVALDELASVARKRFTGKVISVTGSVGKTSVVSALQHVLSQQASSYASAVNFNHDRGVAVSLAQTVSNVSYGTYEFCMGFTPKRTEQKAKLLQPDVGIITEIAPAHLDHPSIVDLSGVATSKSYMFSGVTTGGAAVINADSDFYDFFRSRAKSYGIKNIIAYGREANADIQLKDCELHPTFSFVKSTLFGRDVDYVVGQPGLHNVLNSLAVLGGVHAAGASVEHAVQALATLPSLSQRTKRLKIQLADGNIIVIDDSFNANPVSMKVAFEYLKILTPEAGGRRIAVLGDMEELGKTAPLLHAQLSEAVIEANIDRVYCHGELMENLFNELPSDMRGLHTQSTAKLKNVLSKELRAGDVVLFKCSHASEINSKHVLRSIMKLGV